MPALSPARTIRPDLRPADARQRARVCLALLALADATDRWTADGLAVSGRPGKSPAHPDAQRILSACWTFWDGCSTASLSELLQLEAPRLEAVGELLAAIARGPEAIDGWLLRYAPTPELPLRRAAQRR